MTDEYIKSIENLHTESVVSPQSHEGVATILTQTLDACSHGARFKDECAIDNLRVGSSSHVHELLSCEGVEHDNRDEKS